MLDEQKQNMRLECLKLAYLFSHRDCSARGLVRIAEMYFSFVNKDNASLKPETTREAA